MKRIFLVLMILSGMYASAQVPSNYLNIRSRYNLIAVKADSTLHIPKGTTPSLFTGGVSQSGAIFYKTSDSTVYVYTGSQWISVKGTGSGADSSIFATLYRLDTAKINIRDLIATKLNISDTANIKPRLVAGTNVTITGTYPNLTISASGGSGGISSLGASAYGLIVQNDSTYKADTIQLSTRLWRQKGIDSVQANVNLKLNISDTANIKPRLYAGSNITITGTYPNLTIAASGGGGSADSTVFATQYRLDTVKANRVRYADTATMLTNYLRGSGTSGQFALFNGSRSIYSSSKFVFSDATYPSMSIVGSDPLMYFGGTGAAYPSIGKSGNSIAIYGPSTGKSIGFYDQLVGGKQMLRLYTTSGSVATFSKTAITLDTAVGGPSIGSVHVEYNAGDSTSAGTDVGRHMFRGIGRTYANAGSFNTFYSTVEAGNTTYSQDHIISWQSDAKKTGANTLNIIYHLGILGDSIKAGTVNNRWGVYMYDAKVTPGATLAHQSALRVPKLASAVRNYDMFSDSAQTVKMDGNLLIGDSSLATGARKTIHLFNGTAPSSNISGSILYSESGEFKIRNGSGAINTLSGNAVFSGTIKTADPGSGAGAWKLGTAVSSSGLVLNTSQYVEVSIGGTVYRLAIVDPPSPQP